MVGGACCGPGGWGFDLGATGGLGLAILSELEREIGGEIVLLCRVGVRGAFDKGGRFMSIGGGSGKVVSKRRARGEGTGGSKAGMRAAWSSAWVVANSARAFENSSALNASYNEYSFEH